MDTIDRTQSCYYFAQCENFGLFFSLYENNLDSLFRKIGRSFHIHTGEISM